LWSVSDFHSPSFCQQWNDSSVDHINYPTIS